jgi:hypothetical protein
MTLHSITATYPGFQSLPKGVKQMLLVSESLFFDEARGVQKTSQTVRQQVLADVQHLQGRPDVVHLVPHAIG